VSISDALGIVKVFSKKWAAVMGVGLLVCMAAVPALTNWFIKQEQARIQAIGQSMLPAIRQSQDDALRKLSTAPH